MLEITEARAADAAAVLETIGISYARPGSLIAGAMGIAARLGWAKTYDAEYVALALALECPLLTLDARLQRGGGSVVSILTPADI